MPAIKGLVILGNKQAEIREFQDPAPGPNQVVVAMKAAAICGSDTHWYRLTPEELGAKRTQIILGHEPCGVVDSVGSDVAHVKKSDRVIVYQFLGCGCCGYCSVGEYYYCEKSIRIHGINVHGSMADFMLTDERNCLKLPNELSFIDGMFISCIAGTAYSSIKKLVVSGQDTLFVNGLGPLGLVTAIFGKIFGASVITTDVLEERLTLARDIGIDEVLDASKVDVVQEVDRLTKGHGATVAFDSTGVIDANISTISAMARHGKIVFAGKNYGSRGINLGDVELGFLRKQLTLMGVLIYPKHMYREIARFVIENKVPLESIVTHRFSIEEGIKAMQICETGRCGKVIYEW